MKNTPGLADSQIVIHEGSHTFASFLTQNASRWRTGPKRIFKALSWSVKAQIKGSPGGAAKDRVCSACFGVCRPNARLMDPEMKAF